MDIVMGIDVSKDFCYTPVKTKYDDELLNRLQTLEPTLVAIERPPKSTNFDTSFWLDARIGEIMLRCRMLGIEYVLVYPSEWRKKICGVGNATKEMVIEWCEENDLIYEGQDHNFYEALCIGMYARTILNERCI